ncbi:Golgi transport complex COD1 protein [Ceraceosorus bombacis]|uniref:Conserved oligomeric Golgi complex subunit 4 n=1 Tax=Ceraceosorus bombacis TaxID=401625 RepID=A0A0P1BG45_9BASI|nr:Golgi transport complex COD1 protein [Ceraceosorus bombacis]
MPTSTTSSTPIAASSMPGLVDPRAITTAASARAALATLASHSSALEDRFSELLEESIEKRETATEVLKSLTTQVNLIREEAGVLDARLDVAASEARTISEAVRRLDEMRDRVQIAKRWADRTADLKASLLSLGAAMEQQDWDAATQHAIRAMTIEPEILHSAFAAATVPSSEYPDPPPMTLISMRTGLLDLYSRRFRAAVEAKDTVEATRFFKMFPLIGWRSEGLAVYSDFAKALVRERGKAITDALAATHNSSSLHFHAGLLTTLFEHLALLIDQHQPLVDRNYGPGNFLRGVMPSLQEECDRLGKRIWDSWWDERLVLRKLDSAKSCTFSYISSLGSNIKGSRSGAINPVAKAAGGFSIPGRSATPVGGASAAAGRDTSTYEPEGPDARETDRVLTEIASMATKWGTYRRFLVGRFDHTMLAEPSTRDESGLDEGGSDDETEKAVRLAEDQANRMQDSITATGISDASALGQQVAAGLSKAYVTLEMWYLRSSIERAHRLDTPDLAARPYTASVLDDVFYVLRAVLARSISTSSIASLSAIARAVRWIVDEEYIQVLVRRMEGVWRSASSSMAVDGPRKEAATREMKTTFIVYLNVLSVSADYTNRILTDLTTEQLLSQSFDERQIEEAASIVQGLSGLVARMRSAVRTELDQLFNQLTKPRLKAILLEAYQDVSYMLDDDAHAEAEYSDPVRRRFLKGWEIVLSGYKTLFDESNWEAYFVLTLDALVRPWEKMAMGMRYTELGALRFDKDVRTITTYLSTQTRTSSVREKFTRLQQISYVLNLDESEVFADAKDPNADAQGKDLYEDAAAAGMAWRLSAEEVRNVRALRVAG